MVGQWQNNQETVLLWGDLGLYGMITKEFQNGFNN